MEQEFFATDVKTGTVVSGAQLRSSAMIPFSWNNPYAWPRKPLLAQNVVATSQPLAAQAGLQMLAAGGNAAEAIPATPIRLSLVETGSHRIGAYSHNRDCVRAHTHRSN